MRKELKYFSEKPLYVLAIVVRGRWYKCDSEKRVRQVVERLASQVRFPGDGRIIVLNEANKKLRKLLRKIDGTEIYPGRRG